jgi:serine/threonine protein kinase
VQHCKAGDFTSFWQVFAKYGKVFSDGAIALLESMLVCDPAQRTTFQAISEHPWLVTGTTCTAEQLEVSLTTLLQE